MKLKDWAKRQGICYMTAYRWFKAGKMPCKAYQTETGTIIVEESKSNVDMTAKVHVYARVSSSEHKDGLVGQSERCVDFANKLGLSVDKIHKEVASGMNDKRSKLMSMLDAKPTHIIIENKDRMTRFGFNYIEQLLEQQGCEIIVLNKDTEDETDIKTDLVSIITSLCCRLYGLRSGQNKAKKIKDELDAT